MSPETPIQAQNRAEVEALARRVAKALTDGGVSCAVCLMHDQVGIAAAVATPNDNGDAAQSLSRLRLLATGLEDAHRSICAAIGHIQGGGRAHEDDPAWSREVGELKQQFKSKVEKGQDDDFGS